MMSYYRFGEKIIVLTEGSSDAIILKSAIELLYPHLKDLYYFMDFHISNVAGSAGNLVNTIKSFIGAGIKNKIIALFDNDTAARDALSVIKEFEIPDNIILMQLPDLGFANDYPTLGPTGLTEMNINGLACSIELYLGKPVIMEKGSFIPIQWKGFNFKTNSYQGEIIKKNAIQKHFFSVIKNAKVNNEAKRNHDWSALQLVFETIFDVFNKNE
jgi:hypothetical protein